jgi:hypothetical protein
MAGVEGRCGSNVFHRCPGSQPPIENELPVLYAGNRDFRQSWMWVEETKRTAASG